MRQLRTAVMAAVVACLPLAGHAQDKPVCAPAKEAIQALAEKGFKPAIRVTSGEVFGMFFVTANGDWIEIAITKAGVACIVDGGKNWEAIAETAPVPSPQALPELKPAPVPPGTNPDARGPHIGDGGISI